MYIHVAIALTSFDAQVISGVLCKKISQLQKCLVINGSQRNTKANYGTYQSSRPLCHGCGKTQAVY